MKIVPIPERIKLRGGFTSSCDNVIRRDANDSFLGDEGYIIDVLPGSIILKANTPAGFFYAEKTLSQIKQSGNIPLCSVLDRPRFEYRGFMLDSARHMQSLDEIKRLIDAAALLKLNTMHWHLSDDQGFRIESRKFPLLNEKGSWRESDDFGGKHIAKRYGGFYTHSEISEIVAYCKERFIEVVPEIDLPGHTSAIISAYPHLSCRKEQIPVKTKQGIFEDALCVSDSRTFEFVCELLDEILPLFPCERFHIGGDEVRFNRWKECRQCSALFSELGLKSYAQLQGHFTEKVIEHLKKHGKKVTVWNESLRGENLPQDTTVQMWMDKAKDSVKWANGGGKVITSDFYHYYCDYPYHMTPLKKTYGFNPVLKGIAAEAEKNVIGVEAPIWTEYICDFEKLCYMFFPRFAAIAEAGWSMPHNLDRKDFEDRFEALTPLLRDIGISPAPAKDWNPTLPARLIGTVNFFKDKINPQAVSDALGIQKN